MHLYKFLGTGFVLLSWLACTATESDSTGESREGRPDQESWDVVITLTDEGVIRAKVIAGHLEKFNQRQYILLDQNIIVDFYDETEEHISKLTSQVAEVDEKSNDMVAMGNVVAVSDSGVTLYTDTLTWDSKGERIFTENNVMITTEKNDTLYGVGFESDMSLDQWKILKPSGVTERKAKDE